MIMVMTLGKTHICEEVKKRHHLPSKLQGKEFAHGYKHKSLEYLGQLHQAGSFHNKYVTPKIEDKVQLKL